MRYLIKSYKILFQKRERKRPFERPRHIWEYIKMDRKEIGCNSEEWTQLAQWRALMNVVMKFRIARKVRNSFD